MLCIRINTIIHAECGIRPPAGASMPVAPGGAQRALHVASFLLLAYFTVCGNF